MWYTDMRLSYPDLSVNELEDKINKRFNYHNKRGVSQSRFIRNFGLMLSGHYKRILGKKEAVNRANVELILRNAKSIV